MINLLKDKKNLTRWAAVSLAAALFVLPLSFSAFEIILTIAVFFQIVSVWKKGQWVFSITTFDGLVLAFLSWGLLSTVLSPHSSLLLFTFSSGLPICFYFLVSRQNMSEENRKFLLQMFWFGAAAVAVCGLWEVYSGAAGIKEDWVDFEKFPVLLTRMAGPLKNPNLLAGYLSIVIAFWSGYRLYRPKNRDGILGTFGLLLLVACLLLTYSRGAWLSLFIVLIALGVWARRAKYLICGLICLAGLIMLTEPSIMDRIGSIWSPTSESSSAMRLAIWDSTLYIIKDYPIFGIGWGSFPHIYPAYDYFLGPEQTIIYHAHNLYLHLAAEVGIVGLLLWLSVVGCCLRELWQRICKRDPLAFAISAALGVVLLGGLTDDWLFNSQIAGFFWFLIGLSRCDVKKSN